jgi:trimeric autotransporter adhesin
MLSRSSSHRTIASILIVALLALAALAQLTGQVGAAPSGPAAADPNFWVTDGPVHTSALSPDGTKLYIGGQFKYVGPQTGSLAALNATTGATQSFPQVNGEVKAMVSDGSGGWYIGGNFLSVVDTQGPNQGVIQTRNRLAHITSANTVDPNWTPIANGTVLALAKNGNTVYIAGNFCYAGSTPGPRSHIAALDTNTGAALSWNPGVGVSGACGTDNTSVSALVVSGTTLYVGGTFTTIGGQPRNNLAALNTNNNGVKSWNPSPDNSVYALLLSGTTLYAGGAFMNVGNPPVPDTVLAAFDTATGGLAAGWLNPRISYSVGASPTIFVNSLALSDTTLYFSGIFDNVGVDTPQPHSTTPPAFGAEPTFRDDIAAVSATDGTLLPWYIAPYSDTGAAVYAIALSGDGQTLYLGGAFEWIGGYVPSPGVVRSRLAALSTYNPASPGASQMVKANWAPLANGPVETLAVSGNTVYAGGLFNSVGGVLRNNLAALDTTTGTAVSTWNPGADDIVYALATSGTTIYAGGAFTHIGTTTSTIRNNLAALNTSGTLQSWNPNLNNTGGTGNSVASTLVISGTTIYVGGTFTHVGGPAGTVRNNLAALNTNGTPQSWNPNLNNTGGTGAPVARTLVVNGTTVYAGGTFTHVGGAAGAVRNNLAAIDTSTGQATTWDPNPDGSVNTLALSADGQTMYTGGTFTHMGGAAGTPRGYLAALDANPTGSGAALPWNPNVSNTTVPADAIVDALALYGNTAYVGGVFNNVGGVPLSNSNLTALDAKTGGTLNWAPATDNATTSLTVSDDGTIVYAGFSPIPNQLGIKYFAALGGLPAAPTKLTNGAPPAGTAGTAYSFTFTADGTPAPTFSVTAGSLPPGLLLDASGLLHGTPTEVGSFPFSVTASNVAGQHQQAFSVTIQPAAPTKFTNGAPPAGAAGIAYSFTFTADGTPAPTFSVTAGSLPPGLLLDTSGLLHGTPTDLGSSSFSVTASNVAGQHQQAFTVAIQSAAPTMFTNGAPPAGISGTAYSFTFTANGTPAPTFSVTAGKLPPGLKLDASGLLHGTPTATAISPFSVTASNVAGQHQQAFIVAIQSAAPTMFTNGAPPAGISGTAYSFTFTANEASTPTFSVTAGKLPPGLKLDASGLLHGTPTAAGSFQFSVTASNMTGQYQQDFAISVGGVVYLPLVLR